MKPTLFTFIALFFSVAISAQIASNSARDSINVSISDTIMLGEIVVTGKKPFMTLKDDRFVYNIENSVISNVGNANDVLRRTPYIIIDTDGTISIAGRDKVLILIDDKPIRNASELQLLNSARIRQVEIIENPSAKYEAEGHAVINIITKKGLGDGLNGSLSVKYSQGKRGGMSLVPEIAYDTRKFRIYASVNGDIGERKATNKTINHYKKENYEFKSVTDNTNRDKYRNIGYTLGLDYNISDRSKINAYFDGYNERTKYISYSLRHITKNHIEKPTFSISENSLYRPIQNSMGINYYYKWGSGKKLSFMSNYTNYSTHTNNDIAETNKDTLTEYLMQSDFTNRYNLYSLKLDLDIPIPVIKGNVELGGKYSDVHSNSELIFKRLNSNIWLVDSNFTNSVDFREQILAAYFLVTGKINQLNYSVGLRAENTQTRNVSEAINNSNQNFKLFPNIAIGYTHNDKMQYRLTYSRRISRPVYTSLNNSLIYIDSLSTRHGNPYLKPTVYNTFSANFSYNKRFFGGLSYSYIESPTNLMYVNDSLNIERFTLFYDNVKDTWSVSANAGCNINLSKWWYSQLSASFSYSPVVIVDDNVEYTFKFPAYYFNFNNQFLLPNNWNLDFSTKFYRPAQGMRKRGKRLDMDFGFSKKLLKDKLMVQGTFHYAFFTNYQVFHYSYKYQSNDYDYNSRSLFQVSLKYNFGLKKVSNKIESSSDDEIKRF